MLRNYSYRTWLKYSVLIIGSSVVLVAFVLQQIAAFVSTIFRQRRAQVIRTRTWGLRNRSVCQKLLALLHLWKVIFQKAQIPIPVNEMTTQSMKTRLLSIPLLAFPAKCGWLLFYFMDDKVDKNVDNYEAFRWYFSGNNVNPLHSSTSETMIKSLLRKYILWKGELESYFKT